jgi:hypothetical protein
MTLLEMLLLFWNKILMDYEKLGSLFYEGKNQNIKFELTGYFSPALSA